MIITTERLRELLALREHAAELEEVLRAIACSLSAGGYNAPSVDPSEFGAKIRWGIDEHGKSEYRRGRADAVAELRADAFACGSRPGGADSERLLLIAADQLETGERASAQVSDESPETGAYRRGELHGIEIGRAEERAAVVALALAEAAKHKATGDALDAECSSSMDDVCDRGEIGAVEVALRNFAERLERGEYAKESP